MYGGVAENSVYVAASARGNGVGRELLQALVRASEEAGFWTIQTGVFPENVASIRVHEQVGFRVVGTRERLGKLDGVWRDVVLLEAQELRAVSRVLFVCVQNAGRSQMAEALFSAAAGGSHEARSAGSTPAGHVHPEVVEVMEELGIDLAGRTPHRLETADAEWADVVVTMGCGDACPYIPGKRYIDWELEDPSGKPLDDVRRIRDEIAERTARLNDELA